MVVVAVHGGSRVLVYEDEAMVVMLRVERSVEIWTSILIPRWRWRWRWVMIAFTISLYGHTGFASLVDQARW